MSARTAIALAALCLGACASNENYKVPKAEFLASTKTLLYFPMEGPGFAPEDLGHLDHEVLTLLRSGGFTTVDGGVLEDFDERTKDVDAILFKGLVARDAFFDVSGAAFDGIECDFDLPATGPWGMDDDIEGKIKGLSLYVSITDPQGQLLYEGFGGIGLMHRWNGSEYESVPLGELLADRGRVTRAVEIAVGELAR